MKRVALEKHLRKHGAEFRNHGGRHDRWVHRGNGKITSVSREREIDPPVVRQICKQLGVPLSGSVN